MPKRKRTHHKLEHPINIHDLPDEVSLGVLNQLTFNDLDSVLRTSKKLNTLSKETLLWEKLYLQYFGKKLPNGFVTYTHAAFFKRFSILVNNLKNVDLADYELERIIKALNAKSSEEIFEILNGKILIDYYQIFIDKFVGRSHTSLIETAFVLFCKFGFLYGVNLLLGTKADLSKQKMSAREAVCHQGHVEVLNCLLETFDYSALNPEYIIAPVLDSLRSHQPEIALRLLDLNYIKEHAADFNNTALIIALNNGYEQLATKLLMLESVWDHIDERGGLDVLKAAAMCATKCENIRLFESILEHDAVKSQLLASPFDSLLYVVRCGNIDILDLLITFDEVKTTITRRHSKLLHDAAWFGHLAMTSHLLEMDDVLTHPFFITRLMAALRVAAANGHVDVVNRFLEFEEIRAQISENEYVLLQSAIRNGHTKVLKRLLEIDEVLLEVKNSSLFYIGLVPSESQDTLTTLLKIEKVRIDVLNHAHLYPTETDLIGEHLVHPFNKIIRKASDLHIQALHGQKCMLKRYKMIRELTGENKDINSTPTHRTRTFRQLY